MLLILISTARKLREKKNPPCSYKCQKAQRKMLKAIFLTCSVQYVTTCHMWLFKGQLKLYILKLQFLLTLATCQVFNTTWLNVHHTGQCKYRTSASPQEALWMHCSNSSCELLRRPLTSNYLTDMISKYCLQNNKNYKTEDFL